MKTIARERLVSDLLCLGIAPGDCVMLHSSLSRIGHVDGGQPADEAPMDHQASGLETMAEAVAEPSVNP